MAKFIFRLFFIFLVVATLLIIFLSYFGLETDKFDNLIKDKANAVNRNIKLEFQKTKIHLDISELKLLVKLQNPKVLVKDNFIDLAKLDLFLSIRSFFGSDFLLQRADIAFEKNDIKDLTKITNIFLPRIINKRLNKIFSEGNLEGEFILPFEPDGNINKNYGFSGKISDATINLTKEYSIKNLTTEINNGEGIEKDGITAIIKKGSILDLDLAGSNINIKRKESGIKIKSLLRSKGKSNFYQIKRIFSLFSININQFRNIDVIADLKTNIDFNLSKKFKIKNLSYSTEGEISHLEMLTEEKRIIREYLPLYDPKIIFKNTNIKFAKSKDDQIIELIGLIKLNEKFENFEIKNKYNSNKKSFDIKGIINLTDSKINFSKLNYIKERGKKSELDFSINFVLDKDYYVRNLIFLADKTKIHLSNIKLNKNLELIDLEKIVIKTFLDDIKNNDFSISKTEKIIVSGKILDAQPILNSLYAKEKRKTFSKDFNAQIKTNIDKAITGTDDDISDLSMIASVTKGSYDKLILKGNFSNNEILELSIYKKDEDKKVLQLISDRAKPFIKNFKFIKGFEGGKLNYESEIFKGNSNSNLIITDFKVSKVPVLAQLLTLASLQGIANTLGGEGIDFEIFEMKSNSQDNILNIEEAYASGSAVSILLDGYVDKGKVVSLRGTLVPARWLNSIINKIPIVGKILVGKKTGEGVVGVSFKMKGPPNEIKTTVNPIKTLAPRFIVRAVERIKKTKKNKTK